MKIQVLGSGCAKCKTLYKNVQEVVQTLGINTEVEYSDDVAEIAKLGVMSSPVFAIDGKIMAAGKVPSHDEIQKFITEKAKGIEVEKMKNLKAAVPAEENVNLFF